MEDTRDQQHNPAAPPPPATYQPGAPPEGYYQPAAAAPAPPSALEVAGRLARLLLRRLLHLLYSLWHWVRPRFGWVLLSTVLLGVIGALSAALVLPRLLRAEPAGDVRAAMLQPAPSVVAFLRGQQTYDADLMWESFSPDLQAALEEREITRDALAQQAESERQAGQRYREAAYIGGVTIDGGQRMYFYAVDIDSPTPERSGTFSFIFTVDSSGKIVSVRM